MSHPPIPLGPAGSAAAMLVMTAPRNFMNILLPWPRKKPQFVGTMGVPAGYRRSEMIVYVQ